MQKISERLIFLREKKGYSVYRLSKLSGISPAYIYEIERDQKQPSVEIIGRLCEALGLTVSDFFYTGEDQGSPELKEMMNKAKLLTSRQIKAFIEVFKAITE